MDLRIAAGDIELNSAGSVDTSDMMSSFDSESSRINFWKEINIKDDDLNKNVVILSNKNNMNDKN